MAVIPSTGSELVPSTLLRASSEVFEGTGLNPNSFYWSFRACPELVEGKNLGILVSIAPNRCYARMTVDICHYVSLTDRTAIMAINLY